MLDWWKKYQNGTFIFARLELDQSILKNKETQKEMFMCFGVLTNWVKSMKIKPKCGYLQTELSLASTACNQVEKNPIFLSSHAGSVWRHPRFSLIFIDFTQFVKPPKHINISFCVSVFLKIDWSSLTLL